MRKNAWMRTAAVLVISAVLLFTICPAFVYADYMEGDTRYELTLPSKKGLQGDYMLTREGVTGKHMLLNLYFDVIDSTYETGMVQVVDGNAYYFDPVAVSAYTYRLKQAAERGIDVTLVLLLKGDQHLFDLGMMKVKEGPVNPDLLYAPDPKSEALTAFYRFIARRFGSGEYRAKNFVLGNEVNMPNAWNYTGTIGAEENARLYAETFVKLQKTLTTEGDPDAKVYISLDHSWMADDDGKGIPGRYFLALFEGYVYDLDSKCKWNVAYHLYAPILKQTSSIWKSKDLVTDDYDTPYIAPGNLHVLTDYLKEYYSKDCRVLLSEQGYDISEGEEIQAAGIAFCYYEALTNDMVEAAIFRSYVDEGTDGGLDLGLLNRDGTPREAFEVYQKMDSKRGLYILAEYLTRIYHQWI